MTKAEVEEFRKWHLNRLHECNYPVELKVKLVTARERYLATVKQK